MEIHGVSDYIIRGLDKMRSFKLHSPCVADSRNFALSTGIMLTQFDAADRIFLTVGSSPGESAGRCGAAPRLAILAIFFDRFNKSPAAHR